MCAGAFAVGQEPSFSPRVFAEVPQDLTGCLMEQPDLFSCLHEVRQTVSTASLKGKAGCTREVGDRKGIESLTVLTVFGVDSDVPSTLSQSDPFLMFLHSPSVTVGLVRRFGVWLELRLSLSVSVELSIQVEGGGLSRLGAKVTQYLVADIAHERDVMCTGDGDLLTERSIAERDDWGSSDSSRRQAGRTVWLVAVRDKNSLLQFVARNFTNVCLVCLHCLLRWVIERAAELFRGPVIQRNIVNGNQIT